MPNFISEDDIERAILGRLSSFGYETLDCHTADLDDPNNGSGRADGREVMLSARLRRAARRLNPHLPDTAVERALARVSDERAALSAVATNRELDAL